MKTVFIILNYKTYNDTIKLTKELIAGGLDDRIILIVDNASPNNSFSILKEEFQEEAKVDIISSGYNGGYAKGNNYGLHYAKKYNPQYVCIINNDIHFDMRMIQRMEERYSLLENVAILSPVQYSLDGKPASFLDLRRIPSFWEDLKVISGLGKCPKHVYKPDYKYDDVQQVEIVPGAFLFISYPLFEQLGFFYDGTFLFCEERFTARNVKMHKLCSYILLNERYVHAHSVTISQEASMMFQQKMLLHGKVLYTRCYRNFSTIKILLMYMIFYLSCPLRILKYRIHRYFRE